MAYTFKLQRTKKSRLSSVDFDNLAFGKTFSDHQFIADYKDGEWQDLRIVPFQKFDIHPASMVLHYGQAIFEGMKASKSVDGKPLFFRPEMHAKRINESAARMCMPAIPEDLFLAALHAIVDLDQGWIPPKSGSSLYIRPYMYATDEFIGVRPSETYRFVIFTGPVGAYYSKAVNLVTEQQYVRAVPGGVGEAKAAGNYGGSLLPAKLAVEKGFDQVMWLEAPDFKKVQEVGTMNLFFVIDDVVITPATSGAILKGITRNGFLTILKDKGYKVEERDIYIDEIVAASQQGKLQEAFGSGTAAVVSNIASITHKGKTLQLDVNNYKVSPMLKETIDGLRSGTVKDTRGWVVPVKSVIPKPSLVG